MFPSINNWFISDSFPDNTLYFWKYPEDEEKKKAPIEAEGISLHNCFTENVSLAPREVCSRPNTFMLECRRPFKSGDVDGLNTRVVSFLHSFIFITFECMSHCRNYGNLLSSLWRKTRSSVSTKKNISWNHLFCNFDNELNCCV